MSNNIVTKTQLLQRWTLIEKDDDDDDNELERSRESHIRRLKETWFSEAFKFLINLSRENHIWCGSWDIMGPLLETFHNYFKDDHRHKFSLWPLWRRVSEELQVCMQCICQHHQAKDAYLKDWYIYVKSRRVRLDDWYRPILEMDYYATVGLAASSAAVAGNLKEVPVYFQSPHDYVAVFRPLMLEELKSQLRSSFAEMTSLDEMSCGSLSVTSVIRENEFHLIYCIHDYLDGFMACATNDLLLLTAQPFQTSSSEVHVVGKVESSVQVGSCKKDYIRIKDNERSSILRIKLYLENGSSRLNTAKELLKEQSNWYIYRIMSITSQKREFQALSSLHSMPLLPVILNPDNQPKLLKSMSKQLPEGLQQTLESSFNESQLQAINNCTPTVDLINDHALSLIQGPPGTGKTRTIVAIVSALLSVTETGMNADQASNDSSLINEVVRTSQSAASCQDAALVEQLKDDEGRATANNMIRGRVLICAHSNAAIDELVARISSHGLYASDGSIYKPNLVRIGNAKTVHSSSLPFFIDTLVDRRLNDEENRMREMDAGKSSTIFQVHSKLKKIADSIRFFEAERANLSNNDLEGGDDVKEMSDAEIGVRLKALYCDKKAVHNELAAAEEREKNIDVKIKALKYQLRKSILYEAEIVVSTLNGCGGELYAVCSESMLTHKFSPSSESSLFDAVVIDEAAQALEPATLIPLQLLKSKGGKCIMVGDPKQLPATVLSDVASRYMYQRSMFERLQKAGHPVTMLTKQYRMHPEICRFPSLHFYDGKLLNGDGMCSKEKPFHKTKCLGPYLFFDIVDGQEVHDKNSGSLYNKCEADAAVELVKFFKKSYPLEFVRGKIGIITPYRSQLSVLRSRFYYDFGSRITDNLELNTVDGFQGREVDILVVSTVRAATESSGGGIGFVADVRRMNVALTRAKHSLWILGNVRTLQGNKDWGTLVKDAMDRNLVLSVKKPYASMFNSLSDDISSRQKKRIIDVPSKRERGGHGNYNDKANKKAKVEYYDSSAAARKGSLMKSSKAARNEDFQKEKQWVDRNTGAKGERRRAPVDPKLKGKQPREVVDALLPSALISSSSKSKKKPTEPNSIRQTMTRKGYRSFR